VRAPVGVEKIDLDIGRAIIRIGYIATTHCIFQEGGGEPFVCVKCCDNENDDNQKNEEYTFIRLDVVIV
jgi:hypothetical protein